MRSLLILTWFACMILPSCRHQNRDQIVNSGIPETVEYAKGFSITKYDAYTELIIRNPIDTSVILQKYRLYKDQLPENPGGVMNIKVPVETIACLSTTHIGFLQALHLESKIVAGSGTKYIFNEQLQQLISDGKIKEMGNEGALNTELLVSLRSSIIMAYNMGDPSYDQFDKLQSLHLSPVLNNEYLETTPLGQAEWIKFVAAFFDASELANVIFDSIRTEYNVVKNKVASVDDKPKVFTGMAFKGEWTIPGGRSFAANYLLDAGADYVWQEDEKTGNYPVALEEVFAKAKDADYWLHAGAAEKLQDIQSSDKRYTLFSAFQNGNVFNNNNRVNAAGGNDYWESGTVSPQLILKDLVKIFHPELMTEHEFVYYKQLH
ncbi:MAG: ABC transporter substrate-binding protein [Chitinophagales bacterium]